MTPEQHAGALRCERFRSAQGDQQLHGYQIEQLEEKAEEFEKRLQAVEIDLPMLRLVGKWIIGGAVGVLGLVGVAVVALVLR